MSDFLFIIPDGWVQITPEQIDLVQAGPSSLESWANSGSFSLVDQALRGAGILTDPEIRVAEARMFNGNILVVRFG